MILKHTLALASRGRLSVLIFHRVLPAPDLLLPSEPSAAQFDALLAHIKRRFAVLPLAEAIRRLRARTLPAAALSITFDDGYADNLSVAAPILKKHSMPATVFISTGYLDGGSMFNDLVIEAVRSTRRPELDLTRHGLPRYALASIGERRFAVDDLLTKVKHLPAPERSERVREVLRAADVSTRSGLMLDRPSVRALASLGMDIGAHTVSHPILANTPPDQAWREISDSKRDLEDLIDRPVELFAYPNGKPGLDYRDEHVKMAREAGFIAAMSTARGAADAASDVFQLPRFTPWTRQPVKFDLLMLRNLRLRRAA